MATGGHITRQTENYYRLAVLTAKGCTEVLRALVLHQVELSTPHGHDWTLDDFLQNELTPESKHKLSPQQTSILFPFGGCPTDIKEWDLSLLARFLLDLCQDVDCVVKMDVRKMKDIRNNVCHCGDASIADKIFSTYFKQLKISMERCSVFIDNDDFKAEMLSLVHDIEYSSINTDESVRILTDWYDNDKRTEEQLDRIEQDLKTINSRTNTTDDNMKIALSKIDLLIKHSIIPDAAIAIPDTPVQLIVKNCGDQEEKKVSDMLVKLIDPKIREDPELWNALSGPVYQKMVKVVDEAMKELLSGNREMKDVYEKCVIIYIHCPNLDSFGKLLHQSVSGHFNHMFQPVEKSLREMEGYEQVVLEAYIPDQAFWTNLNQLVDNILVACGYNSDDIEADLCKSMDATKLELDDPFDSIQGVEIQPPGSSGEPTDGERTGTRINIDIKPRSINQYAHIVDTCTSESMRSTLENLARTVREHYQLKDLSIEAKLVEPKERCSDAKFKESNTYNLKREIPGQLRYIGESMAMLAEENTRILEMNQLGRRVYWAGSVARQYRGLHGYRFEQTLVTNLAMIGDILAQEWDRRVREFKREQTSKLIRQLDKIIFKEIVPDLPFIGQMIYMFSHAFVLKAISQYK